MKDEGRMMKIYFGIILFISVFYLYLHTSVPCITVDDSGELAGAGATLGIAHSPGYPVYTLCGKLVSIAFPFANKAYRINLVSSLFISLAVFIIYLTVLETSNMVIPSLAAALIFAFAKPVWGMGNSTEVYGVASLFAVLMVYFMMNEKYFWGIVFFLFGLGIAGHYTLGLMLPGVLWWFFYHHRRFGKDVFQLTKNMGVMCLLFLAGISIVFYIYVRAQSDPVFGWEDPKTFKKFWQVVARLRYGSFALAQGGAPPFDLNAIVTKIIFYTKTVSADITIFGFVMFVAGIYYSFKDRAKGWVLLLLLAATGPGFLLLANVRIGSGSAELLERFFFLSYIFMSVIIGMFLARTAIVVSIAALLVPVVMFASGYEAMDKRNEYVFYDYVKNILRSVPVNTLLFSDRADEMEFAVAYLHLAENQRKDIRFVDCNAGVTRSIYGDDYYRVWGPPRLRIREKVENDIIQNSQRPVYYASFNNEKINIKKYQEGLVYNARLEKRNTDFPFDELYVSRLPVDTLYVDKRVLSLTNSYFDLMAQYFIDAGNPGSSEFCIRGLEAYDKSGSWYPNIAFNYHKKGFIDYAEKYYNKALERGGGSADVLVNLGSIYETKGELGKSVAAYQQAMNINPENPQPHFNLAVLYWKQNKWQDVAQEFAQVLKIDPGNKEAKKYFEIARAKMRNK